MGDAARRVVDLAVVALAGYRLWRLAGYDSISEPARTRISDRANGDPDDPVTTAAAWASELIECPWCLGSWLTFAVAALVHRDRVRWLPAAQALAAATVAGAAHHAIESAAD